MPRYEITSPDGRRFEVTAPDGATKEQVLAYAQSQFKPKQEAPLDPTTDMSGGEKFLAGVGKGFVDIGRGAKQMLGLADQQEIDEARRIDAPLMNTGAGIAGNITGGIAAGAVPALLAPSVAGAAVTGAALNALQPTAAGESRLQNAAMGAALGGGAQYGLGKLAGAAGSRLANVEAAGAAKQAQNAPRDAVLKASQEAGYKAPPSMADGSLPARALEGISGKFKTNQAMGVHNQNITDTLARKAVGLAEDTPITKEALQGVRKSAYEAGYAPIRAIEQVQTDDVFREAARGLTSRADNAAKDFGDLVSSDVKPLAEALGNVKAFSGNSAVDQIAILREKAGDLYAQGNKTLGKAYRKAADAIEGQLERHLAAAGEDGAAALSDFRNARQLIAKTHSVEQALVAEGGRVNAKVFGAALQKNKPLSDELRTIGAFANNFGDVAGVPKSGWSSPITALDAFGAAGMAGMGAGPMALALPAARLGARQAVMGMQHAPQYGPGLMTRMTPELLEELRRRGGGGLLASAYTTQ